MDARRKNVVARKASRMEKRGELEALCRMYGEKFGDMDGRDVSRCARWRLHMLDFTESITGGDGNGLWRVCASELESHFGISVVDVAMGNLIDSRGMRNAGKSVIQRFNYDRDRCLDACSARYRDSQEKAAARYALESVFDVGELYLSLLGSEDNARRFIRKWWRTGDASLRNGIKRALEDSTAETGEEDQNGGGGAVTVTEEADAVTIRISGRAFDNLKKVAEVLGRWDECDYSPAELTRSYLVGAEEWRTLDRMAAGDGRKYGDDTLAEMIASDFGCDPEQHEEVERLRRMFLESGLSLRV